MGQYHHPVCIEAEEGLDPAGMDSGLKEGEQGFNRPSTPAAIVSLVCGRGAMRPVEERKPKKDWRTTPVFADITRDACAFVEAACNVRFQLRATEHARHTTNPLAREGSELGVRRLLSERIVVVPTQSSDRRSCDGSDDRAASTDDRRHDGSQPLASNPTILRLRGC